MGYLVKMEIKSHEYENPVGKKNYSNSKIHLFF